MDNKHLLPHRYKIIRFLGEGASSVVVKCFDSHTKENVAVKLAKRKYRLHNEANIMKLLMKHNLDQKNIIKFHNSFSLNSCLVFEMCDVSLKDYMKNRTTPMDLQEIRTVLQQLATAFDALQNFGIIHRDLKTDNIMVVDPKRNPMEVKLIDFGLAFFTHQANKTINQCFSYKAPELTLGLPYSTALDIWSLGCVMGKMLLNCQLFPGKSEYENLRYFIYLLGPPPDHLVNAGSKSAEFFVKTESNQWRLKTHEEYGEINLRSFITCYLHHMKMSQLKSQGLTVTDERKECIALLKMMLQWDAEKRITPRGILNHPFISSSFHGSTATAGQEPSTSNEAGSSTAMACPTDTSQEIKVVNDMVHLCEGSRYENAKQPTYFDKVLPLLQNVRLDQLAPPENRFLPKNQDSERSTAAASSKPATKQEDPPADAEAATTKEAYGKPIEATKHRNKPKQKNNFFEMCLCCGRADS